MWEYMEQDKGLHRLSGKWREMKIMEQNQSEMLFYIDTEFAGEVLIEVAILNAAGRKIVDTVISHNKSWQELYDQGHAGTKQWMNMQKAKFNWDNEWNMPPDTHTLNASQLATILLEAQTNHSSARFVEFSRGNLDMSVLRRFLQENGGYEWVLGDHAGSGLIIPWSEKLPGFWHVAQALIFELLHPYHPLAHDSHRAFADVQKLQILFQDLVADSAP